MKQGGDPQPSLSAREITAYACKANKRKTAEWGHMYLDTATVDFAHLLCDHCLDGEPLAYILGEWDFYGLTFRLNRSVLIPRPDTERLCELAIERANQIVSPRILDLCCGSGCIGIAVAHEVDDAVVTAVDIDEEAVRLSRLNAQRLGVGRRYQALQADIRKPPEQHLGQFEILASNPPYISKREMLLLDKSVYQYEPLRALYGGENGLDFYGPICIGWSSLLVPGGMILFECGHQQAQQVAALLEKHRFTNVSITKDLSGIPRVVQGFRPYDKRRKDTQ